MPEILVCQPDELADGDVRIVRAGEAEIGVIRHKGEYFAYRNLCPHQGGPACEGVRMFGVTEKLGEGGISLGHFYDEDDLHIVCPWHGYEFRLSDGKHCKDSRVRLQKFNVAERDGQIYVTV
jgi:nitrite reductase/ring-hydroxylating ferredoxin subunit